MCSDYYVRVRKNLENLAIEFTRYAVSTQRSAADLYALSEISRNLKREREGFTFLTSNGITYIPYNGNPDKAWEMDMPCHCYGIAWIPQSKIKITELTG
ncbi:MAG: hypothetical protein K2L07_10320 [Lachnospiraceae bacterium]|nr:hypothetical protein [Lachnospiraceae bacterium]